MSEPDSNAGSTANEPRFQQEPDNPGADQGPADWQRLKQQSGEILEYLRYYLDAKADGLKVTGRKALFRFELELVGLLIIAGAVVVAITLIFVGGAQGLSQLFGNQPWLGPFVSGLVLLGCVGGGGWWWWRAREMKAYQETVQKYEQRKQQQQARFGHDVAARAQTARPED